MESALASSGVLVNLSSQIAPVAYHAFQKLAVGSTACRYVSFSADTVGKQSSSSRAVAQQRDRSQRPAFGGVRLVPGGLSQPTVSSSAERSFASAAQPAPLTDLPDNLPHQENGINVAEWVLHNYTPYYGDASFLAGPTEATKKLWAQVEDLVHEEVKKGGVLDVDTKTPSTITAFPPGYINKDLEVIVGLQTDKPLKRSIKPYGGVNVVKAALESYGYKLDPEVERIFTEIRKTHNSGVFDAYTDEMRAARKSGILTGLPDGYGRGRIIGDYRRVPLYGTDALIKAKQADLKQLLVGVMDEERIRLREEVSDQIRALKELASMAAEHGHDVSRPAANSREAVQWLYYAYLAAVKEQDGAAMSLGRVDAFLDAYFERDLAEGKITEPEVQELVDQFVMKLRIVRHLRAPEYNALFAGDPTWVTAVLGGCDAQGRSMVTKTSLRFLQTLYNLGPGPEPNLTILWRPELPENFKKMCGRVSLDTSSIQYESDKLMGSMFGSDYGIACCVSAMRIGKDMQYFGARANLPKTLLYALNQGRDEITGEQVGPAWPELADKSAPLSYDDVMARLDRSMDWLAALYCNTMNVIHFMHDKYNYERVEMALHDTHVRRFLAFGISGLSVVADSLSAIKYGRVVPVYDDKTGLIKTFRTEGSFPKYGNDDDRVDSIAADLVDRFHSKLAAQTTYRNSIPTLSVLTITSNVVYGKKTGDTPDGRKKGEPFAPGANPLHGRDVEGALASLNSVAKLPYTHALDGISNTFSLVPGVLGKGGQEERARNLSTVLDGYFTMGGHHINVNVLNRQTLMDAMEQPEQYPNLTIRVSGYAVHFSKLTREQQLEVIARTFHDMM